MELWFWRGATAVAVLGWVSTWWAALEVPPAPYVVEPVVREVAARPVVRVVQRDVARLHAIFGGKNPHPNFLVGGAPTPLSTDPNATGSGAAATSPPTKPPPG